MAMIIRMMKVVTIGIKITQQRTIHSSYGNS